jgi:predicted acylesterase/phospholipase RssA
LDIYIKNIAGASMGSFFCLAFALKIPIDELEIMIKKLINSNDVISVPSNKLLTIFSDLGFNDSRLYLSEFRNYIKNKYDMDDITFIQLSKMTGVNMYVSTTRINDGINYIFNVNDTPDVSVLDAIAASMCIPILSKPINIDGYYYVDGCISNNLPFEIFNNINEDDILNVAVYIKKDYAMSNIIEKDNDDLNFMIYFKQIMSIIYSNSLQRCYLSKIPTLKNPLIISDSPFKSFYNIQINDDDIRFNITDDDIENLILQGFRDINNYMKQFDIETIDL